MSVYDDPINAARRLLTIHKDMPWAQRELVELMPLVLDAYDEMLTDSDGMTLEDYQRIIKDHDDEVGLLEKEIDQLRDEVDDLEKEIEKLMDELIDLRDTE